MELEPRCHGSLFFTIMLFYLPLQGKIPPSMVSFSFFKAFLPCAPFRLTDSESTLASKGSLLDQTLVTHHWALFQLGSILGHGLKSPDWARSLLSQFSHNFSSSTCNHPQYLISSLIFPRWYVITMACLHSAKILSGQISWNPFLALILSFSGFPLFFF